MLFDAQESAVMTASSQVMVARPSQSSTRRYDLWPPPFPLFRDYRCSLPQGGLRLDGCSHASSSQASAIMFLPHFFCSTAGKDHQEDRAQDAVRRVQADLHEGAQGGIKAVAGFELHQQL